MKLAGTPELEVDVAGDGAPLVFLHGIGGNRSNWRDQLDHFGASFTAVAWDARGYGDSDGIVATFHDFADDLARLIRHLDRGPAHVVGLSMGGRIALNAWARTPELIASLTLADTSAGSSDVASPERVEAFLAARRQPLLDGQTTADIAPGIVAQIAGPNITPNQRQRLIDSHAALHAPAYLATLEAVTRFTAFPAFEGVTVPVLVIVGEHDRQATPAYAAAMAARFPDARLHVIAGAGHISNVEAPEAFNAALGAFLGEIA